MCNYHQNDFKIYYLKDFVANHSLINTKILKFYYNLYKLIEYKSSPYIVIYVIYRLKLTILTISNVFFYFLLVSNFTKLRIY